VGERAGQLDRAVGDGNLLGVIRQWQRGILRPARGGLRFGALECERKLLAGLRERPFNLPGVERARIGQRRRLNRKTDAVPIDRDRIDRDTYGALIGAVQGGRKLAILGRNVDDDRQLLRTGFERAGPGAFERRGLRAESGGAHNDTYKDLLHDFLQ
jgi:hypothetical protein